MASFNGRAGAVTLSSADVVNAVAHTGNSANVFVFRDQPTLNQPVVMGVTNGSEAVPGQVGEVISSPGTTVSPIGNNSWVSVAWITLTPGDWDVQGYAAISTTTSILVIAAAGFAAANNGTPDSAQWAGHYQRGTASGASMEQWMSYLGPVRRNVTVPTTIYVTIYMQSLGGTAISATGNMYARRRR